MKPVTEDQVQNLLAGLEKREKDALKTLAAEVENLPLSGGRMTARVLRFAGKSDTGPGRARATERRLVSLDSERLSRLRKRTSKGLFFYAAVGRSAKPSA